VIGFTAYYYTSGKSIQNLAKASTTGSATTIIHGFALSCKSTVLPLVVIGIAILISYKFGGFFGIALSAIGMLATTGMVVAVDAYGPIADNSIWPNDPHSSQMVSLAILIGGILE